MQRQLGLACNDQALYRDWLCCADTTETVAAWTDTNSATQQWD